MDTTKLGVLECLYKDGVSYFDEDVSVYLDEVVVECLYNNNKDNFDAYFILANPL